VKAAQFPDFLQCPRRTRGQRERDKLETRVVRSKGRISLLPEGMLGLRDVLARGFVEAYLWTYGNARGPAEARASASRLMKRRDVRKNGKKTCQERLDFRSIQIFLSDNRGAGIDKQRHRFSLHFGDQNLHSFAAHLLGVLSNECTDLTFLKPSISPCDASKPTSALLPTRLFSLRADNMPKVLGSVGQKIPSACFSSSSMSSATD
jgi:hypothetical protein